MYKKSLQIANSLKISSLTLTVQEPDLQTNRAIYFYA